MQKVPIALESEKTWRRSRAATMGGGFSIMFLVVDFAFGLCFMQYSHVVSFIVLQSSS